MKGPLRARPRSNRRRNRSFGLTDTDTDVADVVGERVEKVGAQLLKLGGFEKKNGEKKRKENLNLNIAMHFYTQNRNI